MRLLYAICLLISICTFANPTNPSQSTIMSVTIFVDGAQITRTAKIIVPEGTTEFSFDKLSPKIIENSIQISGLDDISILSINYAINHLAKQDKSEIITSLQKDIELLNEAIQKEENLMAGYEEEIKIIETNRNLGNNAETVSLDKLKQFAAYYRVRITEVNNLIQSSLKKKRELNEKITDIKKQLQELNVDDKVETGEIKVKFHSENKKQIDIVLTYNVHDAGWFPVYDLKAKNIHDPLSLNYKAHVYQNTGVSWNDVKLTLSTNDPTTNNLKPELNPKYLNFISNYSNYRSESATKSYNYKYNPFIRQVSGIITDQSGLPIPGANIVIKGTSNGTTSDFDGKFTLNPQGGQEIEISYLGYDSEVIPIHSSVINVSLNEDVSQLDEVVVVGYGTVTKSNVVGSVSSVRGEEISSYKRNNIQPLYIIDGLPSTTTGYENLNPDLIINIEELKGNSARAIYGSRGANGVILISTKKGAQTSNGDIIVEGINNTNFEIKKTYTIASDGDINVISIENYKVPANFSYFTAPVINENVFLTAKFGDWQQYNLLPGEVNIYFEGNYSGITTLNPFEVTDSLTVSLGVDPNVVVKRKPTNNFKKTSFIGNNRIINKAYDIEIKNNKNTAVDVLIVDRIPISQNKDIKIDDVETGSSEYDDKKGILKWKSTIMPANANTYQLSYSVKYPQYRKINL